MFLGQYRHNIDEKGRLTIPARFRELLADGAYITKGFDQNLMVLRPSTFELITQRVNQNSMTDQITRELARMLFSTAERAESDKNGRILVPQFLRQAAQLDGEAVLAGVGNYFEIWSPAAWEQQVNKMQDAEANSGRFAALDLSSSD
ncbi:MAG: division/cell wall cluster transcriptional repressor MraZ [Chloroflexota bacterium]